MMALVLACELLLCCWALLLLLLDFSSRLFSCFLRCFLLSSCVCAVLLVVLLCFFSVFESLLLQGSPGILCVLTL